MLGNLLLAYYNDHLQAYVWCVSVDNEYIGGVRAVGSGLQSFFFACMLIFYLDSWLCYLTGFLGEITPLLTPGTM